MAGVPWKNMPSATPPMAPASRGNASSRGNLASSRGSLASSRGNLASSRGASRSSRPRTGAEQQQQLVSSRHSSPRVALSSSRSTPRLPSAEPVEDYRLTQGVRVHRHTGATPYAPGEAKAKLPQDYRNQYTDVTAGQLLDRFDRYDVDGSGDIDVAEMNQLLLDYDASAATVEKVLNAVDTNRNGRVEFDEFVALVSRLNRYDPNQLLSMRAMKGACSSDAPSMFKVRGCAVLDRTLGPNFPVRYSPSEGRKVATPTNPDKERMLAFRQRNGGIGTSVSHDTPDEFRVPGVSLMQSRKHSMHPGKMSDSTLGHSASGEAWQTPWGMPETYLVPAVREPAQLAVTARAGPAEQLQTIRGSGWSTAGSGRGSTGGSSTRPW